MLDKRAITRLIELAIRQRDAVREALHADACSEETQKRIAEWKSGETSAGETDTAEIFPIGETARLLAKLRPSYGYGDFQTAYQDANAAAIQAGLGAFLLPKLEAVYNAHEALLDAAREAYEHQSSLDFGAALGPHGRAVSALIDLVRQYEPVDALQVDTREAPLEAPAGTPSPLREAFEAVAQAIFMAADMRRSPPTGRPLFEEAAWGLASALELARKQYAAAERWLQASTEGPGHCAHQEAINAASRMNDRVGHVMLHKSVPFQYASAHVTAVPSFDLTALLLAMRRQTSRASLQIGTEEIDSNQTAAESASAIPDPIKMTITEAAKFVGVTDRTIREWRTNGKLTVIEDETGHLVFSKSILEMLRKSR